MRISRLRRITFGNNGVARLRENSKMWPPPDNSGAFLPEYKAKGIVEQDPFVSLDQERMSRVEACRGLSVRCVRGGIRCSYIVLT